MKLKQLRRYLGSRGSALIIGALVVFGGGYWIYNNYLAVELGRSSAAQLVCTASTPVIAPGQTVTFLVQGGETPTPSSRPGVPERPARTPIPLVYRWSAPNGDPISGVGTSFTTRYLSGGKYTATVTAGRLKAKCSIVVATPTPPPPSGSPRPSGSPTPTGTPPSVPSINVAQPYSASTHYGNESMLITWKTSNYPYNTPVSIYLLRRDFNKDAWQYSVAAVVSEKAINDGYELWQIPNSIRAGDNYFIQVGCPSDSYFPVGCTGDTNDSAFTITYRGSPTPTP